MSVLKTFNERFYFVVSLDVPAAGQWTVYESPIVGDVFEGMAKLLHFLCLEDDCHARNDTIATTYVVSLSPDGPFEALPVSPGWRQSEPLVQDIVQRVLSSKHDWAEQWLLDGDMESFDRAVKSQGTVQP